MKYSNVISAFFNHPWAILPEKLAAISEILTLRASGGMLSDEEIAARTGGNKPGRKKSIKGSVAILPIYGVISQRMGMMEDISGGTSTELIGEEFDAMMGDAGVGAVVLDVSSPGGSVYGVAELGDKIHAARGDKPIIAVVNSLAASAAYWLAAQADEIVITPSGQAGSIGVFVEHLDVSKFEENEGFKTTLISSGKYKVEGNLYEPLSDEARAAMQKVTDDYYSMFVDAVARGRNATKSAVRNGYGEGRVVGASESVAQNLADRVGTLEEVVGELQARQAKGKTGANTTLAQLAISAAE